MYLEDFAKLLNPQNPFEGVSWMPVADIDDGTSLIPAEA